MSGVRVGFVGMVAGLLLLTGCATDDSAPDTADDPATSPSASPSASTSPSAGAGAPDCSTVWVEGALLPQAYEGCNEVDASATTFVERDVLGCSSGQRMVRYADHFYGVLGGTIHHTKSPLSQDAGYGSAVARCRG